MLSRNKKIAQNTIILYLRMIVVMIITLYTSRVVLKALGAEDFGLYNAVGGVVGLFAFLRTSMEKATQRFLNVEMALPNGNVNKVFCVNLSIHIIIAIIILILTETIGLWFLNNYINIPSGREYAANIVYHTVIASLCLTVISVPYSACLIAHERMSVYAIVSVLDAILKLVIAFLISQDDGDKLIIYSILLMAVSAINFAIYYIVCRKSYAETKYAFIYDKEKYREVFSFVGWSALGQAAIMGANQGNNILINMFHGVVANASISIGNQVNSAVVNLSANFQTAFNPQITKSYASGEHDYLRYLLYATSKLSYYLLFLVAIPLMINIDFVLSVWLGEVPKYANIFCNLCLVVGIVNALSTPLHFCVLSTGRIKGLQIVSSIIYCIWIALTLVLFKIGMGPEVSLIVKIAVVVIILFVRLYYTCKYIKAISFKSYFSDVICPLSLSSVLTVGVAVLASTLITVNHSMLYTTIAVIVSSVIFTFFIGLSTNERKMIKTVAFKFLNIKNRNK